MAPVDFLCEDRRHVGGRDERTLRRRAPATGFRAAALFSPVLSAKLGLPVPVLQSVADVQQEARGRHAVEGPVVIGEPEDAHVVDRDRVADDGRAPGHSSVDMIATLGWLMIAAEA